MIIRSSHYRGLRATDGADISTRAKHRAYMKENNLTTIDDFTETLDKAAQERAKFYESAPDPSRREDIAKVLDNG